ncbi:MAG: hypothetical protein EBR82_19135 [Caulobacteraceae bacterium]|nr:hypothetical protein [Caulobacteraceae bacterium]
MGGRPVSIFAGDGIMRTIIGGRVMDNIALPQFAQRPAPSPCELRMSAAAVESGYAVTFSWGRIAGRQPTGFNTRGLITPLVVADDAAFHYFYARATFTPTTLQWTSTEIVEAAVDVANTATQHYTLLGSAKVVDDALQITAPVCGPIVPHACELSNYPS